MDNITNLLDRCQLVENTVKNIAEKYSSIPDPKIQTDLGRLVNRAREYEHGTFIILVVGPAKSGKSTLVNLIAGAYVSPTSFLECTVRPSVISRQDDGMESSLTVYSGTDSEQKLDQVDSIIDIIRGFGSEEDLNGVVCEKLPLTEENIRQRVQLGLERSIDSENLLTSIRTPGGRLLQERVFVIDMPGFDGAYQNIDNPVYETIAQRADLIIFVQSSNAAFSKVSKEFLEILRKNNQNVPVCLVHNVFDAAWWRDRARKDADAIAQSDFAANMIKSMGFGIDDSHRFRINLGAVEDYRKGMRDPEGKLKLADEEFEKMEDMMYERIINRRDNMRLNNSLSRVAQMRDRIIRRTQDDIDSLRNILDSYDAESRYLDSLRPKLAMPAPEIPQPDYAALAQTVILECNALSNGVNGSIKKSNDEAKKYIADVVAAVTSSLNNELDRIFGLRAVADEIYNQYRTRLTELESELVAKPGAMRATLSPRGVITTDQAFDVAAHINIDNIVPVKKVYKVFNGSHTGNELIQYTSVVREQLAPTPKQGQISDPGILARTDVKRISESVAESARALADRYNADLNEYYNAARTAILSHVLPDPESTRRQLKTLIDLNADLKKIVI